VTLGSGTTASYTPPLSTSGLTEYDADITAAIQADAANQPIPWRDLSGLTASYSDSAPNKKSGTASLDGIQLEVTYSVPALEATRCASGKSAPCYLVTNDKSANLFFPGTVYAPLAPLNVTIFNNGLLVFRRGVIARDLLLNVNGSSHKQTDAPFQLPGTTTFRNVLFTAMLNGHAYLRARVLFVDSVADDAGNSFLSPGASVKVQEWTVLR
jgi:hypothetical protein